MKNPKNKKRIQNKDGNSYFWLFVGDVWNFSTRVYGNITTEFRFSTDGHQTMLDFIWVTHENILWLLWCYGRVKGFITFNWLYIPGEKESMVHRFKNKYLTPVGGNDHLEMIWHPSQTLIDLKSKTKLHTAINRKNRFWVRKSYA